MWRKETTNLAFDWCRTVCREAGRGDKNFSKASAARGVESFARADRAFAVNADIWDRDTFLLGTPNWTVDLRSGLLLPPRQSDYITKSTLIDPDEDAECPLWFRFLDEATRSDAALIRFLQQWCGYSLTGDIREEMFVFLFGPGGNGKGVFLNTFRNIAGDYAVIAPMETFTASKSDRHPTELAGLRGARMVFISETAEGRAWDEQRIKNVTGNERISARFMRQDFFEFQPQFKPTIIGNHKPALRNVDDAMRRRLNLAPFVFKPEKPDTELKMKLEAEYPAILQWMIEGCIDWQVNGMQRPDIVIAETADYFADQDKIQQWIEDCCIVGQDEKIADTNQSLFASWRNYAEAGGETIGTQQTFSQRLIALGYSRIKNTNGIRGRGFWGLKVRIEQPPAPEWGDR